MTASPGTPCPSDLALEAHLLDPAASKLGPHLAACAACAARLHAMERQGEDFRRFVYPVTVEKVEEAAGKSRRRSFWLLAPVPIFAALLAVVMLRPAVQPPGDDYTGLKGAAGGVGLTVFTPGSAGATPLADGAHLGASAALRFRVRTAEPCRLLLFSVDATGAVSRLHTEEGALPPGQHDLEGGAVLDGKAGPERFYALCAGGLAWPDVEALAKGAAGGGPDAVRRAGALGGTAAKLAQASVLVEKDAP
ncbi:MAG: hypothetical protein QM704_22770 [Anaeromyxobacteraceae bacterium]